MDLEEDFIKYCVNWALEHCKDDLEFLNKMIDKTLLERLHSVVAEEFVRLPYTEGIKILEEAVANGHKFEFPVSWGMDLASEHERFLVEEHFKKPVIMTDYPKEIKAFYMKINDDDRTVQGTDVLFPQIGEIIGGSVREENYDKLIGARDPQGFRPLCLGKLDDGTWILSSETCGLDVNDAEFVRDIKPGEMVVIDDDGIETLLEPAAELGKSCRFGHCGGNCANAFVVFGKRANSLAEHL